MATATAKVLDFRFRRYAIGFLASPAVANINARVANQVMTIAPSRMVRWSNRTICVDRSTTALPTAQVERIRQPLRRGPGPGSQCRHTIWSRPRACCRTRPAYNRPTIRRWRLRRPRERGNDRRSKTALDADLVQLGYRSPLDFRPAWRRQCQRRTRHRRRVTGFQRHSAEVTITKWIRCVKCFNLPEVDLGLCSKRWPSRAPSR